MQAARTCREMGHCAPVFVLLSFEGPDPYARAGGLSARVSGLATALAEGGYETHLFFVGAPDLPPHEVSCCGHLHLHRWCQWISRYHPGGVYDGEEGKLRDWTASLPGWLEQHFFPELVSAGRSVIVIGEEWHTSWSMVDISVRVSRRGWSERVRCFWNANNTFGFLRVPWGTLRQGVIITSVSRFMKHEMRQYGVDPLVIPNGIARQWFEPCDPQALAALRTVAGERLLLAKVARWDPDKHWLMAVDTVAQLKARGLRPLFVARGGMEAHGSEVAARAAAIGLVTTQISCAEATPLALCQEIAASGGADMVLVETALSRAQLQVLYQASEGVLANSAFEPFGLVGLEAMACGGLSFLGATGEEYATPGFDSISVQTDSPTEVVGQLLRLRAQPQLARRMRHHARRTATRFKWAEVIHSHLTPMVSRS